jgi:Kef-type K+ transport system membrane component KefB
VSPTTLLLLQLVVVLVAARICGWIAHRLGQPSVVGEMAAGVLLGPIVLGAVAPSLGAALFSPKSLAGLSALSTFGLVLFMFVIGLELRWPQGVRARIRAASTVGVASVVLPMLLGLAITPLLHPGLAPAGVGYWPFSLFMAAALSITAFPVMARILKDRGLTQTSFGQLSLAAAAVVDAIAWILLAFVVALVGNGKGFEGAATTCLGVVALLAFVFLVLKPAFGWLLRTHAAHGEPSATVLAALMIGLLVCAMLTEWMHLHAVFGAFLFGAGMPRDDRLLSSLVQRVEPIAMVVLMPLFFALAGLSTTAGAFSPTGLGALALVILAATVGKVAGAGLGARASGFGWSDSLATGALMNARGLMELIVMKIGLDAGLIGREMFTMLLLMALVTTAMTTPMITLFAGRRPAGVRLPAHGEVAGS